MLINESLMLAVLTVAVATDVRCGKIRNWLTLPVIGIGPVLGLAQGGWQKASPSLAGIGVMVLVAAVLMTFHMVGGGDAKLLVAVGSLLGLPLVTGVLLFTGLAGGVLAMLMLIRKLGPIGGLGQLIRTLFPVTGVLMSRSNSKAGSIKLPYSIAIAAGTVAAIFVRL